MNNKFTILPILLLSLLLAGYICSLFSVIKLSSDSFAYIDGAKNLLLHQQYRYDANADSITYFPPLYSIVLSLGMWVGGFTALSIVIVNAILFCWGVWLTLQYRSKDFSAPVPYLFFALMVVHTIAQYSGGVFSEVLFIPLFVAWLIMQESNSSKISALQIAWIACLEILLVSTRYTGILLIASYYLAMLAIDFVKYRRLSFLWKHNYLFRFVAPVVTLFFFIYLRKYIGGGGAQHVFEIGSGKYALWMYPKQMIEDMASFFVGAPFIILLHKAKGSLVASITILTFFLLLFKVRMNPRVGLFLLLAVCVHVLFLYSVWVDDGLYGRYFLWLYLTVFLTAKVEARFQQFPAVKPAIMLLLTVSFLLNAANSYYKGVKLSDSPSFSYVIRWSDRFKTGYFNSYKVQPPSFQIMGNSRWVQSPCYPWNIQRK